MRLLKLLKQPEFYDIFGLPTFIFIIGISLWSLNTEKPLPIWAGVILLTIGVLGIIIDGYVVYTKFVHRRKRNWHST